MAVTKFVLRDNLDATKGFKIDEVAKKISVAISNEFKYDENGAVALGDTTKAGLITNAAISGNTLTLTKGDDSTFTVDLSGLTPTADIHVKTAAIDGTKLVLTPTSGSAIEVDLAQFLETKTANSNTATLTGNGTAASPLKVDVKVDAATDNMLGSSDAGLKVAKPTVKLVDAFGEVIGYAFATGVDAA